MNTTRNTEDSAVSYASLDSDNESDGVIADSFENSLQNIVGSSVENSFKNQSTLEGEIVDDSLLSNRISVINYDNLNISDTDNTKESIIFKRKKTPAIHSENESSENEAEENEISHKNASFNVMQKNPLNYSDDSDSSDNEEQTKNDDSSEENEMSPQSNKLKIEKLISKTEYSDDSDSSDHEKQTKNDDSSSENEMSPQSHNKSEKSMPKNKSEDADVISSDSDHEDNSDKQHKTSPQSNKKDDSFIDDSSGSEHNSSAQSNDSLGSNPDFQITPDSNKSGPSGIRNGKIIDITSSSEEDEDPKIVDDEEDNSNPIDLKPTQRSLKQVNLKSMIQNPIIQQQTTNTKYCTAAEYANQASKVADIRTNILRCKNTLRTTNLSILPDKGNMLRLRLINEEKKMFTEEALLKNMVVETKDIQEKKPVTWEQLQTNAVSVVPRTFGKKAMETHTNQKSLTMDRLKSLHDSLAKCPGEDVLAEDPKGLKVDLMPHQKRALAWLVWREHQKPSGGILADDMGLGKTLTMISLVVQTKEDKEDEESGRDSDEDNAAWLGKNKLVDGGTLVICPATLLEQWEGEVIKRCKKYLISVEVHHGPKRETKANRLAKYDMIITTYKLAMIDFEKKGPLFRIKWKRIILDEAHVVRNHKSQTSLAVCGLMGKSRWALTGTPVHNKELDLYALLKFLRCSPFDDLGIWKHWVANKNAGGQERLNTVMTSILLRRTKEELQNNGALQGLPQRQYELINVALDSAEKQIYQKVLIFSRTLFAQFLHQRKEKDLDIAYKNIDDDNLLKNIEIEEYNKMRKQILHASGSKEVKSNDILVLLLRLRQICCHPSLIVGMLNEDNNGDEDLDLEDAELDIVDRINKMKLNDKPEPVEDLTNEQTNGIENKMANLNVNDPAHEAENFSTAINKVLSLSNPVFAKDRSNEKIRIIQRIIKDTVIPAGEKIIIVSQWTSMLRIVFQHLKDDGIKCEVLDGSIPVHKRNELVVNFNDPKHKVKVLLLSLTAGGVGLNLVGANHLLLLDLHWNPQLESQAQDRIYRVGQTKTVVIYKLVTSDTIEERIKALQDNKLAMASDILSGTRPGAGTKLSLDDLRMLFNV